MIRIKSASPLATIQDLGRHGYLAAGVPRAGAADRASLIAGNLSLGNDPGSAGIEVPLSKIEITFERPTMVALTGAECRASLDSRIIPSWCVFFAFGGQELHVEPGADGVFSYLCFAGGIAVPEVLGSRSTQLRGEFGGKEGRGLRPGDYIPLGRSPSRFPEFFRIPPPVRDPSAPIRVIPAAEYDALEASSRAAFWTTAWRISQQSNRAGLRLIGPPLKMVGLKELRSHGIMPGVIQLPAGGSPIIQMSDAATMGGYPKIATVIDADIDRLAQVRPGSPITFREVSFKEAARARDGERVWREALKGLGNMEAAPSADDLTIDILGMVTKIAGLGESSLSLSYTRVNPSYYVKISRD